MLRAERPKCSVLTVTRTMVPAVRIEGRSHPGEGRMNITAASAPYETRFARLAGCRVPIQSAPVAGVAGDAGLPVAVAAPGGHGMFPALF